MSEKLIKVNLNVNKTLEVEVSLNTILEKLIEMRFKDKWQYITWLIDDIIQEDLKDLKESERKNLSQYLLNKLSLVNGNQKTLSPETIEVIREALKEFTPIGSKSNKHYIERIKQLDKSIAEFNAAYGGGDE